MTILTNVEAYLQSHGRDIDRARFAYHFGDLPLPDMLTELTHYQNADGGFHSLEADIAAPVSNPFATEIALRYCVEAGVSGKHPLLQRTLTHLESTQTAEGEWRFAPDVYNYDLAPWFQHWPWPNLNPTLTLAGLLKELKLGSAGLHSRVLQLFDRLATPTDLEEGDFYQVRPYAFYFLPEGNHPQRETYLALLLDWLLRQEAAGTLPTSGHFFEYVRGPQTYLGQHLPAGVLEARLDSLVAEQDEDGGWPTPYNPAWRSHVTMQNVLVLHNFGRL